MFRWPSDRGLLRLVRGCAALSGAVVGLIVVFLLVGAWPALRAVGLLRFLTDPAWYPTVGQFNLVAMLAGTLAVTLGAVVLATPLGVLSALFCEFYAPRPLARWYRLVIELLAGIPSVVYGFWGLIVLVPLIRRLHPPGPSLLAGILIVAIMVLPTIALVAQAGIASLPSSYIQGAAALGLSRWTTIRRVVLPAARSGLAAGVMLEIGRAIGETMAVLMVCGNIARLPSSLFSPVRTLTATIALEMAYAMDVHRSALCVNGLGLMVMVAAIVGATEALTRRRVSR